jgi:hypothetical protein
MPMSSANPKTRRRTEAGYTLLLVVFMVATMLIAAAIATPNIITEGRRQKEEVMIWRGNQYARAIGLYYRKFGKFPTKVEDLTNQTNGVRFLRQAYPDPMNKADGSWRFIYVGPNGILIGSNRQQSLLQGALNGAGMSGMGTAPLTGMLGQLANGSQNPQGTGAPGMPVAQGSNNNSSAGSSSSSSGSDSQPQPLGGSVVGGNIIGVGSKIDKSSLRVYVGEDNYKNWEFIWNPLRTAAPGQPPANVNGPAAPPGGANLNGQQPPAPTVNGP